MSKSARYAVYVGAAVPFVVYAWFATGAEPFHVLSYVAVGVPVLFVAGLYALEETSAEERVAHYYRERSLSVSLSRSTPWLLLLLGAVVLEAVALFLGGRSSRVPTLSTLADHLLVTHGLRCALFLLWLAVGVAPLRHLHRSRRDTVTP